MKRFSLIALMFAALFLGMAEEANACGRCHAGYGGGGFYGGGFGGYAGPVNPAGRGYRGFGRYPLVPFATPLRPWGGLTPVRQFLFGRGRIRRMNRRAFLFGGWGGCRRCF